jgi:hypothetical protein
LMWSCWCVCVCVSSSMHTLASSSSPSSWHAHVCVAPLLFLCVLDFCSLKQQSHSHTSITHCVGKHSLPFQWRLLSGAFPFPFFFSRVVSCVVSLAVLGWRGVFSSVRRVRPRFWVCCVGRCLVAGRHVCALTLSAWGSLFFPRFPRSVSSSSFGFSRPPPSLFFSCSPLPLPLPLSGLWLWLWLWRWRGWAAYPHPLAGHASVPVCGVCVVCRVSGSCFRCGCGCGAHRVLSVVVRVVCVVVVLARRLVVVFLLLLLRCCCSCSVQMSAAPASGCCKKTGGSVREDRRR